MPATFYTRAGVGADTGRVVEIAAAQRVQKHVLLARVVAMTGKQQARSWSSGQGPWLLQCNFLA